MALKVSNDRYGKPYIAGQTKEFIEYEKAIFSGKIPCPFKAEFVADNGNSCTGPIPLTPAGKPKINLF